MRISLLLLLLVVTPGCLPSCEELFGPAEGEGEGEGVPELTPAELIPALGAMCDLTARCPDQMFPIGAKDRGECIDIFYWLLTCRLDEDEDENLIQEFNELELSAEESLACQAALDSLSCDELACFETGDCDANVAACEGLFASFGDDDDDDEEENIGLNGECGENRDGCREGLFCSVPKYDEEAEVSTCPVCVRPLELGEACDTFAPRGDPVPCVEGLHCANHQPTPNVCVPPVEDGGNCAGAQDCASGACNNFGICIGGGFDGDPCESSSDCRFPNFCDEDGTCKERQPQGGPCTESRDCLGGFCDTASGECGRPDGGQCFNDNTCQSNFCDDATDTCAQAPPPPGEGEPCGDFGQCAAGLVCGGGSRCVFSCTTDDECAANERCDTDQFPRPCVPRLEDGFECNFDEDCLSGNCNLNELCGEDPGLGDACQGFDCGPAAFCDSSSQRCRARRGPGDQCDGGFDECLGPYVCLAGRCEIIPLVCEDSAPGERCAFLRFCDDDSFCDFTTGDALCVRRAREGRPCTGAPDSCEAGSFCNFEDEGPVCRARTPAGGDCSQNSQACLEGTECNGNICVELGDRCEFDGSIDGGCGDGFYCDDERCVPRRQLNEDCNDAFEPCVEELFCDPSAGCQPRPGGADACDRFSGCAAGFFCSDNIDGVCEPRVALGEECERDPITSSNLPGTCTEGLRCNDNVSPNVCAALSANGDSCGDDFSCQSGICDREINRCVAVRDQCVEP